MTILIVSGGEYAPLPGLPYDYVIACDRGYLYAAEMQIRPDLIIGDFDSAPEPDGNIPVERYPSHKDDTDTMLAVKKALAFPCEKINIACALVNRLDHTFANIQAGAYAAEKGADVRLCGRDTEAWIFCNKTGTFARRNGFSLSVFSLTDFCSVSIAGAGYNCRDLLIRNTYPVGISNEWASDEISVTGKKGIVMVMESRL